MKILTSEQIREADAYTIEHEPISSTDLMERAASACVDWIIDRRDSLGIDDETKFVIVCGVGNNGGDGLVMARLLHEEGFSAHVYVVDFSDNHSDDFKINMDRLLKTDITTDFLNKDQHLFKPEGQSIVIDAIFGSGLTRPVEGWLAEVINAINDSGAPVISIDLPSGMFAEEVEGKSGGAVVNADITLTFQAPKLSFLLPETGYFAGDWQVLDIGLSSEFLQNVETVYHLITYSMINKLLRPRNKFSHKGTYGHALLIGGSKGKIGAMVLAARASLRSGTGLVTVNVPGCGLQVLQSAVPEAMVIADNDESVISSFDPKIAEKYNAIGFGPGTGTEALTATALKSLIQHAGRPLVIDADGLNILAENKTWLSFLPPQSILTPHPGEFRRLAGDWSDGYDRLAKQIALSRKYKLYIVLKGAHSSISCPDGTIYFNSTGNPGMATGGSGDTLTGIITGLLAQSLSSRDACIAGVFIHGLAGDLAAGEKGEQALIASDLIDHLPSAFKAMENGEIG